jgi:2-dehydropantoate 2-reductase
VPDLTSTPRTSTPRTSTTRTSTPRTSTTQPSTPQTIAVVGVGAVGTLLAGAYAAAGHHVLACAPRRPPADAVVLESAEGTVAHPVRWHVDPVDVERPVDWVVVATKIQHTAATRPWLTALAGPGTRVVAAQNGVGHVERFAALTDCPVEPMLVYVNAERLEVGHVRFRRTARDLVVADDELGRAVAALGRGSGLVTELAPDLLTATWTKFLRNAAANPVTALAERRMDVFCEPAVQELAHRLLTEVAAVGRAAGARLPDDAVQDAAAWLLTLHPDAMTSMLQDRLAGREMEVEGIVGTTVDLAHRYGIDVPVTTFLRTMLAAADHRAGPAGPAGVPVPDPRRATPPVVRQGRPTGTGPTR